MVRILTTFVAIGLGLCIASASAQQVEGVTSDTVKVGVIGPFSGPAAEYSKVQVGAIAYLKHVNDRGGVHGRKFEILVEDDGCEETKGIAAARKLIFEEKVFALASAYACSGPPRGEADYC